ncbi:MAG: baseplate J/gp47 family protein [Burkholderiales bacterium]|nr:baseplate J/gp47 family protein [Burkholderiales bacterium]
MNNVSEYIRQLLLAYDNNLDLREGSALNDLLVNAGAAIITDLKLQQDELFQYLTLENPDALDEDTLDTFAKTFLVNRQVGSKASGYVRLYFSSPRAINIPAGTRFESAAGLLYETIYGYSFTEADLRANNERYPYYSTGDVYIEALEPGVQFDAQPGKITKLKSVLPFVPAQITNPRAIEGSTEHDTNSVLYTKILNAALNKTLYTSAGLQTVITEQFPTIQNIVVVGTDNEKMLRDLAYSANLSGLVRNVLYERSDYYGSFGPISSGYLYSGILAGSYYHFAPFNESVAYYNGVSYSGTLTSGVLPATSSFNREFSIDQYAGLYKKDSSYALIETRVLLDENFDHSNLAEIGWKTSDSAAGLGYLRYSKEIEVANGFVRLGYTPTTVTETSNVLISPDLFDQVSGLIDRALAL